ncbi:MAG: Dabb family protein [Raoultibacter sp.]
MFSAVYMVTFAEKANDAAKKEFATAMQNAANAITPTNLAANTLTPPMPGGDYFCELGFKDQNEYDQVKEQGLLTNLESLLADKSVVDYFEFVAFGEGILTLQEKKFSNCHRVLIFSLLDDADPAMVAKMESSMNGMTNFVPGLKNCKLSKVVESSGTNSWDYAYECDFDEPTSLLGKYMTTPYHFCYIDKFFEPACNEWIVDTNLATPYCAQEKPFLANFID